MRSWAEVSLEITGVTDTITVECLIRGEEYTVADKMVVTVQCESCFSSLLTKFAHLSFHSIKVTSSCCSSSVPAPTRGPGLSPS